MKYYVLCKYLIHICLSDLMKGKWTLVVKTKPDRHTF